MSATLESVRGVSAENSAPSSHLVFNDDFPGDIIVNSVRVPASGEATYTYYETLGWRGPAGGYAGIQAHPNGHVFIYSIWDHTKHTAPIKAEHLHPGTRATGFGGEGTGLKSMNFEIGWAVDTWYTLVSRAWPVDDHTHFGFWSRDEATGRWTHLVTMDVATPNAKFEGRTDAFLEDWLDSGANERTAHYRNGWKRNEHGTWQSLNSARYSVNSWDLAPGKRSYTYRSRWDGGVASDEGGAYFFLSAGGDKLQASTTNPSSHQIAVAGSRPAFEPPELVVSAIERRADGLAIDWTIGAEASPQFAYMVEVFDAADLDGSPIAQRAAVSPQQRSVLIKEPLVTHADAMISVRLRIEGLFGQFSDVVLENVPFEQ